MQHLKRLPLTVLILTVGQFAFALVIIAITGHGVATLNYAPYEKGFFTPLAEQVNSGTLDEAGKTTVAEIVKNFPVEVNGALQLSKHADKTALAVAVCMLFLPIAILVRTPRRAPDDASRAPRYRVGKLFLVIETFKAGKQREVYQRAQDNGRMLPAGVTYIDSWVTHDLTRCFQLMSCD
ncbi:MAG: DUF3303 domain-containing protein, partial [Gammaproteobacteria bacterium]|nr:DUF3303 domain-containing protein [Gammaproteobacteria bacterium]